MKSKFEKGKLDTMSKDPNNWRGIFYVNKKDPRIVVPKLYPSMGWTLNFGNINAYLGLVTIISIIIVVQLFS